MSWKLVLPKPTVAERMNVSRAQLKQLERDNKNYPVDRLVEVPREEWPPDPRGKLIRLLRSRDFLVQVRVEPNGVLRLSVQRCAFDTKTGRWKDGISWDDLQHLKSLAGYGDKTAIEIFPPDAEVVNVANLRHIWIVPEAPEFMWKGRG